MTKVRPRMGRASHRAKSRPKSTPPVVAKGVEATPGVMNVQGLSLGLFPLQVELLRSFDVGFAEEPTESGVLQLMRWQSTTPRSASEVSQCTCKFCSNQPGATFGVIERYEFRPRDFWDQAVPREALESFIHVPEAKSCRCQGVFPVSDLKCCRG